MRPSKLKILKRIWMLLGFAFICWLWYSYQAKGIDGTLESNSAVRVEQTEDMISFIPARSSQKMFIFYPGSMVDPLAYAPLCRKIADRGVKSVIIKMPSRLPGYGYKKIKEMNLLNDSTKEYILAGHSKEELWLRSSHTKIPA